MLLALFFLLIPLVFSSPLRVKRQWGPTDFYHFEQWVNYVNRPRQSQYSADGPHWGEAQYPAAFNRNIQPHTAPAGWQLHQQPYWFNGQWGGFRPSDNRPPVLIETNVYRPNTRVPVPTSVPTGYGRPPQLFGAKAVQPFTTTTTMATTTTITTIAPITEDERERFIQTAVKEDIDVMQRSAESLTTSLKPSTSAATSSIDSEAKMNTRSTTSEAPSNTTTSAVIDLNPIWSEDESSGTPDVSSTPSAHEAKEQTVTAVLELTTTEASIETTGSSVATQSSIPEAEEQFFSSGEPTTTGSNVTTTGDPLYEDVSKDFQSDLGFRSPPLPLDVAKKLEELGVSIEKAA